MSVSPTFWCIGAVLAYGMAALPARRAAPGATAAPHANARGMNALGRSQAPIPEPDRGEGALVSSMALLIGWLLHLASLLVDADGGLWFLASGAAAAPVGPRLGFAPVLSGCVWLVIAVHAVESRLLPLPAVRMGLALAGACAVLLACFYPGEVRPFTSALGPWHFLLGVASYGLIAAAALHGLWLGAAESRLRSHGAMALRAADGGQALGMPLLQLERLTFRFVQAGFAVLSLTLVLGMLSPRGLRLEHKTVFSLLAWASFGVLLLGRATRGWRGRLALRWLYGGTLLLLLAYVGSRFVFEVLLGRPWQ